MFVSPVSNEPTTAYSCSTVRLACWSAVTELNGLKEREILNRGLMEEVIELFARRLVTPLLLGMGTQEGFIKDVLVN